MGNTARIRLCSVVVLGPTLTDAGSKGRWSHTGERLLTESELATENLTPVESRPDFAHCDGSAVFGKSKIIRCQHEVSLWHQAKTQGFYISYGGLHCMQKKG